MGLPVSRKYGVNPTMALCERCGKETGELLLLGRCNEYACRECGAKTYGRLKKDAKCSQCGSFTLYMTGQDVEAPMHLKHGVCEECRDRDEEHATMVRQGGVYWRCETCGSTGVVRPGSGLALVTRHHAQIAAPKPVGIDFGPDQCPVCRQRAGDSGMEENQDEANA